MSILEWKIHIVFLKIKIANISPVIRALRSSTACSATVPCTAWSTAPEIPGISRKTADGSRIARAAPSRMIRSIMMLLCRSCGRRNTFFWKINTYFAHFSKTQKPIVCFRRLSAFLCAETVGFEPTCPRRANAFRVRPVMTTSIRLQKITT